MCEATPVSLFIPFAFGRTASDQECGIGNQDDSLLPMLRQIWNLRLQQTQGIGLENESLVDFTKPSGPRRFLKVLKVLWAGWISLVTNR
jgi:hypothetical protein